MNTNQNTLSVPNGTIAYDDSGEGPLIVCVPGMGDLRASYRHLAPALVVAGYRVVTTDLRGHGDSSTGFPSYGDEETAGDVEALLDHLGSPAVIVGNSMGASAAMLTAARRPELVTGLVLLGPFGRNPKVSRALTLIMRAATAVPWVTVTWKAYLPSLYAGRKPADQAEYTASLFAALRRPGYAAAFSRTTRLSHDAVERALPAVHTPSLVLMGGLDPDFPDPRAEADWLANALGGTAVMVPDAGHYPQSQRPDLVVPAIESFLTTVVPRG
ncbi:alpha/beta hydrolase [Conyzicola nivalis]|uniref:Hydrolase n=1 Tax=Conyzicola nivalis TaxID=1477021 RepID=A0A916SI18_9MICO|nr:alpha/beta hydrolase [Conyzicola nivalis]GGA98496.1 hydrolase [Conyzicola nivalis]